MSTISADGATDTVYLRRNAGTGNVEYAINSGSWSEPIFPLTIVNTNGAPASNILQVIFTNAIRLTSAMQYITCGSDGIQFGSPSLTAYSGGGLTTYDRASIVIDSVVNYPGLIQNGTFSSSGFNNIYIYNLVVDGSAATLAVVSGWLTWQYFGKQASNNYIINCASSGDLTASSGGIVGARAGSGAGASLTIIGCSSAGALAGNNTGGIIGAFAGSNGGSVECIQCWSSGAISGGGAGGIFGDSAGAVGGSATATKCYSTGVIGGNGGGGIFGQSAASSGTTGSGGVATAVNCYSTGNISSSLGGGIFGSTAASVTGSSCLATNCYSAGTVATTGNGIYGSGEGVGALQTNCYIANGSWANAAANTALSGTPPLNNVGTIWVYSGVNQPYELVMIGPTPYSTTAIAANALVQNYAQSVVAGGSAAKAVNGDASGNNYSIVGGNGVATITINKDTGILSTTAATPAGTYTIYVRGVGSYIITTFTLTVLAAGAPVPCCAPTIPQPMLPYDTIEDNTIGTLLIQERARKPYTQFTTYMDYIKYKLAQSAYRTA